MKNLFSYLFFSLLLLSSYGQECRSIISMNHYKSNEADSIIAELKNAISNTKIDLTRNEIICKKRLLASALTRKGHYKLAILQLQETKNFSNIDTITQAIICVELGNAFKMAEEYALAIEQYLKGAQILESHKEWKLVFNTYVNISEYYRNANQYKKSNEYLERAFATYETYNINDSYGYTKALGRKAALLNTNNSKYESIAYSRKVIQYGINNNDPDIEAMARNEIGSCYRDLGFPDSAYYYYDLAIKLWESEGPSIESAGAKYNKITCLSRNSDHHDSILTLCRELETYVINNKLNYPIHFVYYRLFKEFEKAGIYDSAIHYQRKRYKAYTADEIKKLDDKIYEIQTSYENEKIIAEKLKIENDLKISNTERIQVDYKNNMLLVFSILILLILTILIIFFRQQKNLNKLLKVKNEEKDILIKEINHRVKNNMQMVSSLLDLQAEKVEDLKSKKTLIAAGERIKALAFAHKKLYLEGDFSVIRIKDYFKLIGDNLLLKSDSKFELNFDDRFEMNIEKAQSLGFIVNELITNSLKHAWPDNISEKKITITIRKIHSGHLFEYQDNGIGISDNFNEQTFTSLGLNLIKSFVNQQLNSELIYSNANGCLVNIEINE